MRTLLAILLGVVVTVSAHSQERAKPANAKGGKPVGEPRADVPELYKNIKLPQWPVPTDLAKWQKDRIQVRKTLQKCLGNLPVRPDPRQVKVVSKEDKGEY